jgi:carbamoyltransferase
MYFYSRRLRQPVGKAMNILGISCFYHDSAACLVRDGEIVAAAQEERFTRKKHDPRFPKNAAAFCLKEGCIGARDLQYVVYYDKPLPTFERLLLCYLSTAPKGLRSWLQAMPLWLGKKLHVPTVVRRELGYEGDVLFTEHHEAHAASAFYPSPFDSAAILTVDGVGEWATGSCGSGDGNKLTILKELRFPDSVGLLYSAFTYFAGFRVNSGEYKLMGLAPYGTPRYKDLILSRIVDVKEDGSIRLDLSFFNFMSGLTMTGPRFSELFGGPPRTPESEITAREADLAASIQTVTEDILLKMARHLHKETGRENLCLAGGVALNCVANSRVLREGPFKNIWVQPAAGDAGGALGAALAVWHRYLGNKREAPARGGTRKGSFLGPSFTNEEIRKFLGDTGCPYRLMDRNSRAADIAKIIADGLIVGYFSGRMEFGPRALGARSILGDPRKDETQSLINTKIKFRESFRPLAPSVLEERARDYFDLAGPSPYMLFTVPVNNDRRLPQAAHAGAGLIERLRARRSDIPAVTHLDYSARVQTVSRDAKPDFHAVIAAFEKLTGCAVLVNTSFNVRGEPIVCTPQDAYRCFMNTGMDALVMEDCLLFKKEQPAGTEGKGRPRDLVLD